MLLKKCGLLLALVGLQCLTSPSALGQCFGREITQIWYFPDPVPAGWSYVGPGQGPFSYRIGKWSSGCPPASWCPKCGTNQGSANNPINLANGNTYIEESDVRIPGLGGGLSLERTWNSVWPASLSAFQTGMFGPGWRSTYEERVFTGSGDASGYMVYLRADGGTWYFGPSTGSSLPLASPANKTATLTSGATYWTLKFQNGEQRQFDINSGSLIAIIDRNGNTTTVGHDLSNRITTVTDPASRTLTFSYGSSSFPSQATSVSSSVGLSLSYSYDTQGRLTQVTLPDLSTITFAYNAQSLITSVTDAQGKVLESHTYDSKGRGATASQANGVNAVTVTYP